MSLGIASIHMADVGTNSGDGESLATAASYTALEDNREVIVNGPPVGFTTASFRIKWLIAARSPEIASSHTVDLRLYDDTNGVDLGSQTFTPVQLEAFDVLPLPFWTSFDLTGPWTQTTPFSVIMQYRWTSPPAESTLWWCAEWDWRIEQ